MKQPAVPIVCSICRAIFWHRSSGRERKGRLETTKSTWPLDSPAAEALIRFWSSAALPWITWSSGKRCFRWEASFSDISMGISFFDGIPRARSSRVTDPVPAPSSTTSPLWSLGMKEAIRRPRQGELGHKAPVALGFARSSRPKTAMDFSSLAGMEDLKCLFSNNLPRETGFVKPKAVG